MENKFYSATIFFIVIAFATCTSKRYKMDQANQIDSVVYSPDTTVPTGQDTFKEKSGRWPASIPEDEPLPKGYAMVYCPAKMIKGVPSIVNATITKEELSKAYNKFITKITEQDNRLSKETIARDIKGDSIDLYQEMKVVLEYDTDDFKQISKDENLVQSFAGKLTLDWEWTIKPLKSTRKSILKFKFYGIGPSKNAETYILQKTINISAEVDARSFLTKWTDFLLDDPKTTLTAILIPVITFFGGFISGKKKN